MKIGSGRVIQSRMRASLDSNLLAELGDHLRRRRETLGLSVADSAHACLLSEKQIAAIEFGTRDPFYADSLADTATRRYAALLGIDLSRFEVNANNPTPQAGSSRTANGSGTEAALACLTTVLVTTAAVVKTVFD